MYLCYSNVSYMLSTHVKIAETMTFPSSYYVFSLIHVFALIKNSHNKTKKFTNVKSIFFYTITPWRWSR